MSRYINIALKSFADKVVKEAKLNVGASRRGRRIEASGRLRKSISYKSEKPNVVAFYFEDYGVYVDSGRDGKRKKHRSKKGLLSKRNRPAFPNIEAIKKWIDVKPIRVRNLKTNKFIKRTPQAINSAAYLIGRKIENEGIKPTFFFSDAIRKYEDEVSVEVVDAVWNQFKEKI